MTTTVATSTDGSLHGDHFAIRVGCGASWITLGYKANEITTITLGHLVAKIATERPWWSGADLREEKPTLTDAFGGEWLVSMGESINPNQHTAGYMLTPDGSLLAADDERAVVTYIAAEAAIQRARRAKYQAVLDLAALHTHAQTAALLELSPRSVPPLLNRARRVESGA